MSASTKVALIAVALGSVTLAGCENHSKHHFEVNHAPSSYQQRHPITIGEKERTLDVPVGGAGHELSKPMREAVTGFAQGYANNPASSMRVMMPTGSPNAHTASALGSEILEALSNGGVDPSKVEIMHYDASLHGRAAPIRLSYHAVAAEVAECGRWNADLGRQNDNRNYTNFGCATQSNLAAVVANPADLLGPRASAPIDGANRAQKIEQWRQRGSQPITLATPSTF